MGRHTSTFAVYRSLGGCRQGHFDPRRQLRLALAIMIERGMRSEPVTHVTAPHRSSGYGRDGAFSSVARSAMIVSVAIAYALISCLFMLVGYVTTTRDRLHLALSILASALWPVSILVVASYVCGLRLAGIPFGQSGAAGEREGAS